MNKVLSRIICFIMAAVIVINCCACSAVDIKTPIDIDNQELSAQEIVRLVVKAIGNKNEVSDSYTSIPESQRADVSYSYFNEYVNILRTVTRGRGSIESFTILNDENSDAVINEYLSQAELSSYSNYTYGKISAVKLNFSLNNDNPIYLFISFNDAGVCYLSNSWISSVISLYNYCEHYLTMLEEENINGIFALIRPTFTGPEYTDDVVYSRAQRLSDFYKLQIRSNRNAYKFSSLNPFAISVTIPETVDLTTGTVVEHSFMVRTNPYNSLLIIDDISVDTDDTLLNIYKNNNLVATLGSYFDEEDIYETFGTPYFVSEIETDDGVKFLYSYEGVILSFLYNEDSFTLVSIKIYGDSTYHISDIISYGSSISDILIKYPFLVGEGNSYILNYSDDSEVNVEISLDDNLSINSIRASI